MSDKPKKVGMQARRTRLLAEEAENEPAYWWMSFCDASRAKGEQFLGASIVRAPGFAHAVQASHDLGCNPGGEIQGMGPMPEIPPTFPVGKLLSKAEWNVLAKDAGLEGTWGEDDDA